MQIHGQHPMSHVPMSHPQGHPRMTHNFMPPHGWTFVDPNQFYQINKIRNNPGNAIQYCLMLLVMLLAAAVVIFILFQSECRHIRVDHRLELDMFHKEVKIRQL